MTHDSFDVASALTRKNQVDPPRISAVDLQVRTAIGFQMKQDDESKRLLADRPGASWLQVVWQYAVPRNRWNDFTAALREGEQVLFKEHGDGQPVRYLGTYVIQEKPEDDRLYVTSWGCATVEDAKVPSSRSWTGPQDGASKPAYHAIFRFVDLKTATITTRGLGAAVDQ
jgi:hypothetical protein